MVDQPLSRRLTERRLILDQQQMYFFFNHLVGCANILTPELGRVKDLARRERGVEPCPELLGAGTRDSHEKQGVSHGYRGASEGKRILTTVLMVSRHGADTTVRAQRE